MGESAFARTTRLMAERKAADRRPVLSAVAWGDALRARRAVPPTFTAYALPDPTLVTAADTAAGGRVISPGAG